MAEHDDVRRQVRLLTARIAAAERAAGMTDDDTVKAASTMQHQVRERLRDSSVRATTPVLLAFQLAALHTRLRNAENRRTTHKTFGMRLTLGDL